MQNFSKAVLLVVAVIFFIVPMGCVSNQTQPIVGAPEVLYPQGSAKPRGDDSRHQPPPGFSEETKLTAWAQAATGVSGDNREAFVKIDYMKVVKVDSDGQEESLFIEDYNGAPGPLGPNEGGLFTRNPWFGSNDNGTMRNTLVQHGMLTIDVGKASDRVSHWWTPRLSYEPGYEYYLEVKIMIHNCFFQMGWDFWDGYRKWNGWHQDCKGTANCEGPVSPWYGHTDGEFVILRLKL